MLLNKTIFFRGMFIFPLFLWGTVLYALPEHSRIVATEEISPEVFSFFGIPELDSPVQIQLKGNEIDLSSVISAIERVNESHHYLSLRTPLKEVNQRIEKLCQKSSHQKTCIKKAENTLDNLKKSIRFSSILYSHSYSSNAPYFGEKFKDTLIMNEVISDCNLSSCSDQLFLDVIIVASPVQYKQLYDNIKKQSQNCLIAILRAFPWKFSGGGSFPKECLEKENQKHPVCNHMLHDLQIARERFLEIAELTHREKMRLPEIQTMIAHLKDLPTPSRKLEEAMFDLVRFLGNHHQCLELQPGEKKIIYYSAYRHYTLKRELDGTYTIPLYFSFSLTKYYDGELKSDDEVQEYYMEKVQSCMKEANKKIIGPNGEKLRIMINNPGPSLENEKCYNLGRSTAIHSKGYRSSSSIYASNITCPDIIHEVLHRLGLKDEYQESHSVYFVNPHTKEIKFVNLLEDQKEIIALKKNNPNSYSEPAYNCRVLQNNSIMSHHKERLHFLFEKIPHWFGMGNSENSNSSLLDKGHFNRILYGECLGKNKVFNECLELSHQNSFENKGCIEKRNWCKTQNVLGRNKQDEIERLSNKINRYKKYKDLIQSIILSTRQETHSSQDSFISVTELPVEVFLWMSKEMAWMPQKDRDNDPLLIKWSQLYDLIMKKLVFLRSESNIVKSWPDRIE